MPGLRILSLLFAVTLISGCSAQAHQADTSTGPVGLAPFGCTPDGFALTQNRVYTNPDTVRYNLYGNLMLKPGYSYEFVAQPTLTADNRVYNLKLTPSTEPTNDILKPLPIQLEFANSSNFQGIDIFVDNVWGSYESLDEYRITTISCRRIEP